MPPVKKKQRLEKEEKGIICVGGGSGGGSGSTGAFQEVDKIPPLMALILSSLNLRERIVCLSSVCKTWRQLKTTLQPQLFTDLTDKSIGTIVPDQYDGLGTTFLPAKRIQGLFDWLDLANTNGTALPTKIRISTTKNCDPNECKEILKQLADAKKNKQKQGTTDENHDDSINNISTLIFAGKKIYGSVLTEAIKQGIVGPNLKRLVLQNIEVTTTTKLHQACLGEVLKLTSGLEELALSHMLAFEVGFPTILNSLCEARGEGATTTGLRVLDFTELGPAGPMISAHDHCSNFSWNQLKALGIKCPELRVLKVCLLHGQNIEIPMTAQDLLPMEPLPHLHTFLLESMTYDSSFYPRDAMNYDLVSVIVPGLLDGMPSVKYFSLGYKHDVLRSMEDHPSFPSSAFLSLPTTIESVTLSYWNMDPDSCQNIQIPSSLKEFRMVKCGPNMKTIAEGIATRRRPCPISGAVNSIVSEEIDPAKGVVLRSVTVKFGVVPAAPTTDKED